MINPNESIQPTPYIQPVISSPKVEDRISKEKEKNKKKKEHSNQEKIVPEIQEKDKTKGNNLDLYA